MIKFGLILVMGFFFFASCASHKKTNTVEVEDKTKVSEPQSKTYSVSNEIDGKKIEAPKGKAATDINEKKAVEKKIITKKPQKVNK